MAQQEPIAIIGAGCRFPGAATTPSKLWEVIREAQDLSKDIPIDRFNVERFYHPNGSHHGTSNVRKTYFLEEDVRHFDSEFFSIPAGEAAAIDPQHRLLLETVYESLEASGLTLTGLQGSNTSVFVGIMCMDYASLSAQDPNIFPTYNVTGVANSNASARISYFFDWHGPSMTIDTACSSSLVAVHQAVQALRAGTSRVAVAAGTNLILCPWSYIAESKLQMLSPTGYCHMWDARADGYARGEGVGTLILKKLQDAIADGDHVECIIRETGVNQDGKTKGLTMPNAKAQARLIRDTYSRAGLNPLNARDRCQYFEAHGTGTPAGDPQEAEAIQSAFFPETSEPTEEKLLVGSIKTIVGHTEGTAGIAGIMKTYLAMQHGIIPKNLHFGNLSESVRPFYKNLLLVSEECAWPATPSGVPRRASVNSFGFGGTNAHAILESYTNPTGPSCRDQSLQDPVVASIPFVFSAQSNKSLLALLKSYQEYLQTSDDCKLNDLAYTLATKRTVMRHRISIGALNQDDLCQKIESILSEKQGSGPSRSTASKNPSTLYLFTGQGAQWPRMGHDLLCSSPVAKKTIKRLDDTLQKLPKDDRPTWSIAQELQAEPSRSRVLEAAIAQPLTCAVQIMLVQLLRLAGVKPSAVVGHSSGEIAAAYAAGLLSDTDAIVIAYYRGLHVTRAENCCKGSMLAVGTSLDDAKELCDLDDFAGRINVAALNSPSSVTLSGDSDAILEAQTILEEEGKFSRILKVDKAYHSHHMLPIASDFLGSLKRYGIKIRSPGLDAPAWFSSVHPGTRIDVSEALRGRYWSDNLRLLVQFYPALKFAISRCDRFDTVIEVGPHPALKAPSTEVIEEVRGSDAPPTYTGTLVRGKNDVEAFLTTLGTLWTAAGDLAVDLKQFFGVLTGTTHSPEILWDLPIYPWDHNRILWFEARSTKLSRLQEGSVHDLLGIRDADGILEEWTWKNVLKLEELSWLADHSLQGQPIFPATGYLCIIVEAALQIASGQQVRLIELNEVQLKKALAINPRTGTEVVTSMTNIRYEEKSITALFSIYSSSGNDSLDLALNTCGEVYIDIGEPASDILPSDRQEMTGMRPVNVEHFYNEFHKLGYNYGPTFQQVASVERKLGASQGRITTPNKSETETALVFHPAMLDAAMQTLVCAFSYPGDGRLWSLHAPTFIQRMSLVPQFCGTGLSEEVSVQCHAIEEEALRFHGNLNLFHGTSGLKVISLEGIRFTPFTSATQLNDITLYSHNTWGPEQPDGFAAFESPQITAAMVEAASDGERVAFYYLRKLHRTFQSERTDSNLPRHTVALLEFVAYLVEHVRENRHSYIEVDWLKDSHEDIAVILAKYGSSDPYFSLMAVVGTHLAASVRGETSILEHLMKNNRLEKLYSEGILFKEMAESVSCIMAQISYRYPNISVIEVGAGTGSATRPTIAKLGIGFASYTYTDISSMFFASAQQEFKPYEDRMRYEVLDVTKNITSQGFERGSYDVVIASNVLHATPDLESTLKNVRSLLRPGGYLVLLEMVNVEIISKTLLFGGLPGWWAGVDNGRPHTPSVDISGWDRLLRETGFTGIETSTPTSQPLVMQMSVMVTRALDQEFDLLREPLVDRGRTAFGNSALVIVGGQFTRTKIALKRLLGVFQPHYNQILQYQSWDDLRLARLPPKYSVLSLSDFDGPLWKAITSERFNTFRDLLLSAAQVVWASWGSSCENRDAAMTLSFFRSARHELPQAQIQFIDFEDENHLDSTLLARALFRLEKSSQWSKIGTAEKYLWTVEPELHVRNGKVLIPRVRIQEEQNDRYNSEKRLILKLTNVQDAIISVQWSSAEQLYHLRKDERATLPQLEGHRRIEAETSLLCSWKTDSGRLFFGVGTDMDTRERMLFTCTTQASKLLVPHDWSLVIKLPQSFASNYLSFFSGFLACKGISDLVPTGCTVILHEAEPGLALMLSKIFKDLGSRLMCTTTDRMRVVHSDWVHVHPRATNRDLKRIIPRDAFLYCDLSSATNAPPEAVALGARLSRLLPESCEKRDQSVLLARESSLKPGSHGLSIQSLLKEADDFVINQLQLARDGQPQPMFTLEDLRTESSTIGLLSLLEWQSIPEVRCKVEPICCRNDLFRSDKTYWLVGLANDMGMSLCDFMISQGARYVVLSSRAPKIEQAWLSAAAAKGAKILIVAADVTVKASLLAARDEIEKSMPPIWGVANGSLVLNDKGLVNMTLDTFHAQTRSKVEGSTYLSEIFTSDVDWFIAFSSMAATAGNVGQMAYTAANMYMKALISHRKKLGWAGSVIDLAPIIGIGYLEREKNLRRSLTKHPAGTDMRLAGLLCLSETDLLQIFAEAIISGRKDSKADPEIITGIHMITAEEAAGAFWKNDPRLSHYIKDFAISTFEDATSSNVVSIKTQLESVDETQVAATIIKAAFIAKIKSSLMLGDDQTVDGGTILDDLGLDSLVAVEVRTWFTAQTGVEIAVLRILSGLTINELVNEVVEKLPQFEPTNPLATDSAATGTLTNGAETNSIQDDAPKLQA